jgi:4,5-DOPA dioxygenase extradiol
MSQIKEFNRFTSGLPELDYTMPVLFMGHGSPMNGIEDNEFSANWEALGRSIPEPTAILVISAHWFTQGTHLTAMEHPKTIHDFHGFPKALFDVQYPAPGHPGLASEAASLIKKTRAGLDHEWGLDHGTWSVVRRMYPLANIPIVQLSIDYSKDAKYHYDLAADLISLRRKGVLIIGSGNMVHNLRIMDWHLPDQGYDWATELNEEFKNLILTNEHSPLIHYSQLGKAATLSIPTPEHYLPLIYTLGLQRDRDEVTIFNDKLVMGSISMTSVQIG